MKSKLHLNSKFQPNKLFLLLSFLRCFWLLLIAQTSMYSYVFLWNLNSYAKITAYLNPVKLYYFFLPVDIYCVFLHIYISTYIQKLLQHKKKKKMQFFLFFSGLEDTKLPPRSRLWTFNTKMSHQIPFLDSVCQC